MTTTMTPLHSKHSTAPQARLVSTPCRCSTMYLMLIMLVLASSGVVAFPALARPTPRTLWVGGTSKERSVSCHIARSRPVFELPGRWITRRYPVESSDVTATTATLGAVDKTTSLVSQVVSTWIRNTKEVVVATTTNSSALTTSVATSLQVAGSRVKEHWWCSPMILALVPVVSIIFLQRLPSMPPFWRVGRMDDVFHSPYASYIIGSFLLSNLSYLLSGAYLLLRLSSTPVLNRPNLNNTKTARFRWFATRYTWLGAWIMAAGFISTIFHSVQALGPYALAEGMCYLDHAVALSAMAYFWHVCGPPTRTVWSWGIAALVILALPVSSGIYAYTHSAWHFLSATAATIWALQGFQERQSLSKQRRQQSHYYVRSDPLVSFNLSQLSSQGANAL